MIVPMKKVSLIMLGNNKNRDLKELRKLGLLHIEISEGSGEKLLNLKEKCPVKTNESFVSLLILEGNAKLKWGEEILNLSKGDSVVMTGGKAEGKSGNTNIIKVETV